MDYPETIEVDGVTYTRKQTSGPILLVRTYSAGVHFGTFSKRDGKEITLTNARRLFSWNGACSLSQVARSGVDLAGSKISVAVPEITLTEAIELIPMSEEAGVMMMEASAWKQ